MAEEKQNTRLDAGDGGGMFPTQSSYSAVPEGASLEDSGVDTGSLLSTEYIEPAPPPGQTNIAARFFTRSYLLLGLVILISIAGVMLIATRYRQHPKTTSNASIATQYGTQRIPLAGFLSDTQGVKLQSSITLNGQLTANQGIVLTPSETPANSKAGQLYYDQNTNQLAYFNGSQYIAVTGQGPSVQSIGGVSGALTLGGGLSVVNNQLSVAFPSTTPVVFPDHVTSIGGVSGTVTVGRGLAMNGSDLQNSGVLSIASGTPSLVVSDDGNGNITISNVGGGSGTVTSSGGTAGRIAKFTGAQNVESSLLADDGVTITVNGDLSVTGTISLSAPLAVSQGGTGTPSLANNGVVIGQGAGALTAVTAAGAGLCLISTAGAPAFQACPSGAGVASLDGLSGALTIANTTGVGSTVTINDASTAAKGIATFNSTNFSVIGGTVTTIQNISTTSTPTFNGVNTNAITPSGALTVGATSQNLTLQGAAGTTVSASNGGNTTTLSFQPATANVTYRLATAAAGSYDICTTAANCAGVGGGVTTSGGTTDKLAKFSGAQTLADSIISDNGTLATITGNASVTGSLTLGAALGVGYGGTGAASFTTNGVLIGQGSGAFATVTAGGAGLCLISSAGAPSFQVCPGSGGVTSVNGLTGVISIANATTAGSTITLNDATTAAKGIASFNSTNFSVTSGAVNTIQDINSSAAPTFGQLSLTSSQASNPMLLINNTNTGASGALLDLQVNGSSKFSVQPSGNVATSGTVNGQTISNSASFTGTMAVAGNTTLTGDIAVNGGDITSTGALNITPGGTLTVGSGAQTLALQGGAGSTFAVTSGANTTTVNFQAPTANVTYRIPTAAAGTYDICTTVGNCATSGGGVTTAGGSTNRLAKFSGAQVIGDSTITDNGTTVTTSANMVVQGGTLTSGVANSQTGSLVLAYGSANFSGTITQGALTANRTYTLPDASGTFCLNGSSACGFATGSGAGFVQGGNTFGVAGDLGTNDAMALNLRTNGTTRVTIGTTGNATFTGDIAVNGGDITSTGALNVTPSGALTLGSSSQTFTMQGDAASSLAITSGANTTAVNFQAPTANVSYRFATAAAGSYDVCTTAANCAGVGGAVTTAGGTTNRLAKFTGGQAVGDSTITDNGTTVSTTVNFVIQGGTGTIGVAGSQSGTLALAYAGGSFTGSIATGTLTASRSYTLPDASGTVCLSTGNCLGGGSGGANTALSNLSSVAINTSLLPGTTTIDLGASSAPFRNLYIAGSSVTPATNNFQITGAATAARTITLPDASGTVCLNGSASCGFTTGTGTAFVNGGNTLGAAGDIGTNDAFDLNIRRGGATQLTVGNGTVTFASNADLLLQGASAYISNAQGTTNGESFGAGAVTSDRGIAVGSGALNGGTDAVAIGYNANSAYLGVAIGAGANGGATGSVAVGAGATVGSGHTSSIALGYGATTTASNQLVIGAAGNAINQVVVGNGVTNATPTGFTLQGTSGSGTNIAGASVAIAGGAGTGSANGGAINFQVAKPGTSGSSANAPTTVLSLSGNDGSALFKSTSAAALEVQSATGSPIFTVNTSSASATVQGTGVNGSGGVLKFGNDNELSIFEVSGDSDILGYDARVAQQFFINGTKGLEVSQNGQTTVSSINDSFGGFRVEQSNGNDLFGVSAAGSEGTVAVGYSGDTEATLFILDNDKDELTDPTGVEGAMYYSNGMNKFRCYQNTAWTDCISSGSVPTLQAAYNASTNPEIVLNSTNGALTVRDNSTPLGANLFEVQSNNGSAIYFGVNASGATVGGTLTVPTVSAASGNLTLQSSTNILSLNGIDTVSASGAVSFLSGGNNNITLNGGGTGSVNVGTNANNKTVNIGAVGTTANTTTINVGTSTGAAQTVNVGSAGSTVSLYGDVQIGALGAVTANARAVCRDDTTGKLIACDSGSGTRPILQGGNSFGVAANIGTNDAFDVNIRRGGTTQLTVGNGTITLASNADLILQGATAFISNTQGQTRGESFGAGASVSGADALAVGNAAASVVNSISLGSNAVTSGFGSAVAIGHNSYSQDWSVAIGEQSAIDPSGQYAVAVGSQSTSKTNGIAIGYQANADSTSTVALGKHAVASGFGNSLAIGSDSYAQDWSVTIGGDATVDMSDSQYAVTIGNDASGDFQAVAVGYGTNVVNGSIALGYLANATAGTNGIAIGRGATTSTGNEMVIGGPSLGTGYINHLVVGSGVTDTTPQGFTLQGTGGSGSNVAGAGVNIAAGQGTGTAAGGTINLQTSAAGSSGSTLNSLTTVASFNTSAISLQTAAAGTVSIGTSAAGTVTVGNGAGTVTLQGGTVKVSSIGSATGNSVALCRDSVTTNLTACNAGGGGSAFVQGGNAFAATAVLGTTDANNLQIVTNGGTRATFDQSASLYLGNGVTAPTPSGFTVKSTGSSAAGTAGGGLVLQGGAGASATTGSAGGNITIAGGVAGGSGNNAGGGVILQGGSATGSGTAGGVLVKNTGNSANAFQVQNASSSPVLVVDTTNSRVAINTTAASATETLQVEGSLRVSGGTYGSYTTPNGTVINAKVSVDNINPSAFGQVMALGVTSSANTTARVLALFDGRLSTHQPSLALLSPNENNVLGLNWNGSSATGWLMTSDLSSGNTSDVGVRSGEVSAGSGSSGSVYLQSGDVAGGTGYSTGSIFIRSGNGGGTNASSGTVNIDTGTKTGSGTNGAIIIGATNASGVQIGRASGTVSINGPTTVTGGLTTDTFSGAGLMDCDTQYSKLLWDATTSTFTCGTDRASLTKYKASDETRTTTTFANDADWQFTVGANETWAFQIMTSINYAGTLKFGLTAPSGASCQVDINNLYNAAGYDLSTCATTGTVVQGGNGDDEEYFDYGTVKTGGTGGTFAIKWALNTATGTATERLGTYMVAYKLTGADVAEAYYTKDKSIMPGTVVAVDGSIDAGVQKTSGAYDGRALGIVSTEPGMVLGDPHATNPNNNKMVLLALNGRVPVRVSMENGPIEAGDYLTTSSTPGVAMKATRPGQMIGKAMSAFSSSNPNAEGMVTAFTNLTYADPHSGVVANNSLQGATSISGDLNISGTTTTENLVVTGTATIKNLIVGSMTAQEITVNGTAKIAGDIQFQGVGQSRNAVTKQFKASKPVAIGDVVVIDSNNDGQVTTTTAVADRRVIGIALTAATQAGDTITVAIGGSVQVHTLTGSHIQGGDLLVSGTQEGSADAAADPVPGSMIGKALGKPDSDGGLVWTLITLD